MVEQLIKKNCKTGEYSDMYPITSLDSVIDTDTGKALKDTLHTYNHLYLPFKGNSKTYTRIQVPTDLRRKGLWITYTSCMGNVITEWYNSDDFSDKEWGNSNNWVSYINKCMIKEVLKEMLTWYKA